MSDDQSTENVEVLKLENDITVIKLGTENESSISLTEKRLNNLETELLKLKQKTPNGLIITGISEKMFCVGADINLINNIKTVKAGEKAARKGQSVFNLIEDLNCTTVAAISGPCVGGGFELALACNYRIITDSPFSQIGLPETKLGILPGFGGTQRLPRLIGLPSSLSLILEGKLLRSKQALKAKVVDAVYGIDDIIDKAQEIILNNTFLRKTKLGFVDNLIINTDFIRRYVAKKAHEKTNKKAKGNYPALPAAIDTIIYGLKHGTKKGYEREAKELGRLIVTPECKSLVKLFFLTESAKSLGKSASKHVRDLSALVIGGGVMGAGIATVLLKSGARVIVLDTKDEQLTKCKSHISNFFEKRKYISEKQRESILSNLELKTELKEKSENLDIVIEAIVENLDIKQNVLKAMASKVSNDTIICSNTSSLSIEKISEAIPNPERVIGMHFFNPVEKMPLIEIIRTDKTSPQAIVLIAAITNKIGKHPVIVEDVPGFLVNRILTPYLNEAAYLLSDGYSVKDIDKAATSFGMPMGPLRLLDEIGLDVATYVSEIMLKGYGDRMLAPSFASELVKKNFLGKKSDAGFYKYSGNQASTYNELYKLLDLKTPESSISDDDSSKIKKRLIFSMLNEAILCLDEGVAGESGKDAAMQIDLATVMGMGFPPFRGGLLHYAESLTAKNVLKQFKNLEKEFGSRFAPCKGIIQRGKNKKSFFA